MSVEVRSLYLSSGGVYRKIADLLRYSSVDSEQSTRWARKIGRRNSQSAHSLSMLGGAAAAGKLAKDKQKHGMQMKSEVYAFGHGGWGELGRSASGVRY